MFGYHKAKREKKRLKRQMEDSTNQQKQYSQEQLDYENKQKAQQQDTAKQNAAQTAEERKAARAEGRQHIMDLLHDPSIQGLDEKERSALQYEANKQIQRGHQSASRKLMGDQSQRGIVGKGGVAYAQQKDLQRLANESQGQATRDLDKLNSDLRMKNVAAIFAGEQGEAAQRQLDKQMALDELRYDDEKKRQRTFEDQFNRLFSRL